MHTHGEPGWPDPARDGTFTADLDMGSDQYLSANRACEHLLPKGKVIHRPVLPSG
jgi:hypothetical protein